FFCPLYVPVHVVPSKRKNSASTLTSPVISTVHAAIPVHAPFQPTKKEPGSAFAVSVSFVLGGKLPLHVCPLHVTPAGVELMVPVPWSVAVKAWLSLGGAGGAGFALASGGSSPSSFEGLGSEPAFGEPHPGSCNSRLAKIAMLAQRSTIFETPLAFVQRQC